MGDLLALFYLITAAVWLYRSKRAFEALRENPRVERAAQLSSPASVVSILLPVKNEEANLDACLRSLVQQNYSTKEIIVINDHSIDRTGEILSEFVRAYPDQIRTLEAPPTPAGWTGKNWALAQGVKQARGDWFLFTDADTRHDPWAMSSAIAHAEAKDLGLLTLTPRALVQSFWEKTLQPAAMGLIGLWFPMKRVNDPRSVLTFGNGQYLLIRKKTYEAIGGHAKVREAFLEDFALVREAKQKGARIECAMGSEIYGTRMYRSFLGIWTGWRRIFFHAFEKNPARLFTKAFLVFAFSFLPFFFFPALTQITLTHPEHFARIWGATFPILAVIVLTAWKTHRILKAPSIYALLHPFAGFILAGILADAAWSALQRKELKWR